MSWQRILESARKNGLPIIVTDIAGREPMVVMPFDTFEELNEVYRASPDAWDEGEVGIEYSELEPGPDDRFETPPESYNSEVLNELQGQENTASKGDSYASEGASDDVSHLSMEERFYLEPVDDDQ